MFRAGITVICLVSLLVDARNILNGENENWIAGEYLVVLHPPTVHQDVITHVENFIQRAREVSGAKVISRFTAFESPILHIKVAEESVSKLLDFDEVRLIDANVRQQMLQQCSLQPTGEELWGLSRVSSREIPDYPTAAYNFDQSGGVAVRVYIIDSGIRITHNDFESGRAVYGVNIVDPESDPTDGSGHGTHCAGIVAGSTYGVSKSTTVVAVKSLSDSGSGSMAQIIAGLNWVMEDVAETGARGVLSMSLGGSRNEALDSAVEGAIAAGIPVVAAAGNSNANACLFSPAGADGVITVAGTDRTDSIDSLFTNWGPCVDILAPSRDIRSASHLGDDASSIRSGSSMATAFVTGQVANYLNLNPEASPAQVTQYLQQSATRDVIDLQGKQLPNLLLYASCE